MNVKELTKQSANDQNMGLMKCDAQISAAFKAIDWSGLKLSQEFEDRLRKAIVEQVQRKRIQSIVIGCCVVICFVGFIIFG